MEWYRDRRSPDRGREIDSYIPPSSSRASRPRSRSPGGYRGRSRTPPRGADSYRGRPSSPSRRFDLRVDSYSSRDSRPRSPRKDYSTDDSRYENQSRPLRDPSPPGQKRARDGSSHSLPKNDRSPQRPLKREKDSPLHDSRTSYRPRSRSPRREERVDAYNGRSWRRSQSPRGDSGHNSVATSRRSSPRPSHIRRPGDSAAEDDARTSASYQSPRPRLSPHRDSPRGRTATPHRTDSEPYDSRLRMGADQEHANTGLKVPTGPSNSYRDSQSSAKAVPTGPSSASPGMSAHGRPGHLSSASSYGRGAYGGFRGRGGPPPPRDVQPMGRGQPSWGSPSSYGRSGSAGGPSGVSPPAANVYDNRASVPRRGSSYSSSGHGFRGSGNGTSLTTPRTQRFNQAMAGIPEVKPGGEKMAPLHDTTKAEKLEEEAARLRKLIDEKEMKKRQGLKEWDKLERESANAALRSELAEEHLRSLNGEGEGMAAAF